jgi:DNA modification methylase
MSDVNVLNMDVLEGLRTLPDNSVNCCVTSPPYWGLRDYGHQGQIGLEDTPQEYVTRMVEVFREVRRVLRDDGTLWLNLGDTYANTPVGSFNGGGFKDSSSQTGGRDLSGVATSGVLNKLKASGLKQKDLCGIPWRVAFALQEDGWFLRQDIIWHKPNPMPESVTDRCTKAHEYIFLMTKNSKYYYDNDLIKEPVSSSTVNRLSQPNYQNQIGSSRVPNKTNGNMKAVGNSEKRNKRSVWTVTTKPFKGAHFAVMPQDLVEPCVKAGCPEGGVVLDPFAGSGTTLVVASKLNRSAIGIELNPDYVSIIEERLGVLR